MDDNVDAASTLKARLEGSGGFEVDVAYTGGCALMVEESNYDSICVDIGLPALTAMK